MMKSRSYSELIKIPTFEERFEYLKLDGAIGVSTFGYDRYLNQILYNTKEWRSLRNEIFIRDNGCDLGIEDRPINYRILVHHINPITVEDIVKRRLCVFDPDNLITTYLPTHNAIHYGDKDLIPQLPGERRPGETCPWK